MTRETATLVAACIAAAASLVVLLLNLRAQRRAELRVAHRQTLDLSIAELAEALHQSVACASIILKAKSDGARARWKCRGAKASSQLKSLRPRLRYPLWGLDEGLRVLSRVPDWAEHARADNSRAQRLVSKADGLRKALDYAIRRSYRKGRAPTLHERLRVRYTAWQCRRIFVAGKAEPGADEDAG